MSFEPRAAEALDYFPCRYGSSRTLFRGPRRRAEGDYIAFLGGTETYGKFVPRPFPGLVEDSIGVPCVNLGVVNAGPDFFLNDDSVLGVARGARAVVLQVPGAQNLSNRYYSVHPRRNDRFLKASRLMRMVFRDRDFTDFNFTGHLIRSLRTDGGDERFAMMVAELQEAWVGRMSALIASIERPVVLLWMADHAPAPGPATGSAEPMFIGRDTLAALRPSVAALVEVTPGQAARDAGNAGKIFNDADRGAATELPGPLFHADVAGALGPVVSDILARDGGA